MINKQIENNNLLLNLLFKSKNMYGGSSKNINKDLKPFIFGIRHDYSIIDVRKVSLILKRAFKLLGSISKENSIKNGKIIIIGNNEDISFLVNKKYIKDNKNILFFEKPWVNGLITNKIDTTMNNLLEKKEIKLIIILKSSLQENFLKKELSIYQVPTISLINTNQHMKSIEYPIISNTANIKSIYTLMYLLRKFF
jgi:ribosomal protein S2